MNITLGNCVICSKPKLCSGYDTCGNSYCQEARHFRGRMNNARRPVAKKEYADRMNAAMAQRDEQLARQ